MAAAVRTIVIHVSTTFHVWYTWKPSDISQRPLISINRASPLWAGRGGRGGRAAGAPQRMASRAVVGPPQYRYLILPREGWGCKNQFDVFVDRILKYFITSEPDGYKFWRTTPLSLSIITNYLKTMCDIHCRLTRVNDQSYTFSICWRWIRDNHLDGTHHFLK